jgi:hypothetical protein
MTSIRSQYFSRARQVNRTFVLIHQEQLSATGRFGGAFSAHHETLRNPKEPIGKLL